MRDSSTEVYDRYSNRLVLLGNNLGTRGTTEACEVEPFRHQGQFDLFALIVRQRHTDTTPLDILETPASYLINTSWKELL